MSTKRFAAMAAAAVIGVAPGVSAQAQTVLTYNGATKGDWFAPGVWLDEAGAATDWQDSAVAVITNKEVTLTADASVHGFQIHMTGRCCVYGGGKMTLGAGGVYKTGSGEFNIQNGGGLHLSASQAWTSPNGGMVCLDGRKPVTAADGVTLTCDGGTVFRVNSGGGLGSNTTVRVAANASLSFSAGGRLGSPAVILDGSGNRLSADAGFVFGDAYLGHRLLLRNGASVNSGGGTFDLAAVEVDAPDAPQAVSTVSGDTLALARAETGLDVASGATLQLSAPLTEASGVAAALRKTGAGTLVLNAAGTFSGGVSSDSGWVRLAQPGGAGSGAVALAAASVLEITAAGTVANAVTGGGRVVKSGTGALTLTGANDHAGGTSLSGGVTRVSAPSGLGGGAVEISAGASLVLMASQTVSAADVARIAGSGTVLAGVGAEVVWSGDYAVGGGLALDAEAGGTLAVGQLTGSGYTKTLPGKLRVAGTVGYSGEIVVEAGVLEIGSTAVLAEGVTVRTENGGRVQLDTLEGQELDRIAGTRAVALKDGADIALDTDALTVTLSTVTNESWSVSALTGASELVKTGPGTLVVSNAAGFTGRVRVLDGTLLAAGALGGNTVTVSNGVFAVGVPGVTLQNSFSVAGGTLLADNGGSLGAGAIALLAGGTVAATNAGSLGSGALAVSAGTLRMDAGGTAGTRAVTLSGSGRVDVYDGAGFDDATFTIGGGTLDFRATTTMGRGVTLTANTRFSASTPDGAAVPTVGTLAGAITTTARSKLIVSGNGQLRLAGGGEFIGSGEIFVQGGGDLTIVSNAVSVTGYAGLESNGKRFAIADGGTFTMTDSGKNLHAGYSSGACTFEVLTGGVFRVASGINVLIGANGAATTFLVRGGTAEIANGGQLTLGSGGTSSGVIELGAGGTLKTSRQFKTGGGAGSLVFNGGTLQSDGANSSDPRRAFP